MILRGRKHRWSRFCIESSWFQSRTGTESAIKSWSGSIPRAGLESRSGCKSYASSYGGIRSYSRSGLWIKFKSGAKFV